MRGAVTQWFRVAERPKRNGWYEVRKGKFICMGYWTQRGFKRFNSPSEITHRQFWTFVCASVRGWRGLAEKAAS